MIQEIKHTTIRNGNLFCTNCGAEHALVLPIDITEMTKKTYAFNELHSDCKKIWFEPKVYQKKDVTEKAYWWLNFGEKGLSSEAMWNYFMDTKQPLKNHPHDPNDFGRCYQLIKTVPEWQPRINELSKLSTAWKNLAENWDKLTQMYEKNENENWQNYEKIGMYEFMQTLIN